ncbi:hypothetical protein HY991_03625 [Candidatus Micrarchaeota archaeon]|nr:hypothetical protein [Candidatus Micrarchaeota archaeon]
MFKPMLFKKILLALIFLLGFSFLAGAVTLDKELALTLEGKAGDKIRVNLWLTPLGGGSLTHLIVRDDGESGGTEITLKKTGVNEISVKWAGTDAKYKKKVKGVLNVIVDWPGNQRNNFIIHDKLVEVSAPATPGTPTPATPTKGDIEYKLYPVHFGSTVHAHPHETASARNLWRVGLLRINGEQADVYVMDPSDRLTGRIQVKKGEEQTHSHILKIKVNDIGIDRVDGNVKEWAKIKLESVDGGVKEVTGAAKNAVAPNAFEVKDGEWVSLENGYYKIKKTDYFYSKGDEKGKASFNIWRAGELIDCSFGRTTAKYITWYADGSSSVDWGAGAHDVCCEEIRFVPTYINEGVYIGKIYIKRTTATLDAKCRPRWTD